MSTVLYYSKYCRISNEIIKKISRSKIKKSVHFLCVDKRIYKNNQIHIVLENDSTLQLPKEITCVPSLIILNENNRIIYGREILNFFKPKMVEINNIVTKNNEEPLAFSVYEMGNTLSDNYSYCDQGADEMVAKGSGGLRQMHNYVLINDDNLQKINTPEDDYEPDKVGNVDMEKMQAQRQQEISINK